MDLKAHIFGIGILLLYVGSPNQAFAQQDCLHSLSVSTANSVTYLALGPDQRDRLTRSMTCVRAETLRGDLFLSGQAVNYNLPSKARALRAKVAEIREQLVVHNANHQKASTKAARESILLSIK